MLDRDFTPLAGYLHLLRAKADSSPRFKYVDATIAAELAVKDALSRIEPKIEKLLLEVPSPPVDKLYGSVLAEYAGESSPHRKAIRHGAEMRNKLVHRHNAEDAEAQSAVAYCFDVQEALAHLIGLLPGSGEAEEYFFRVRYRVSDKGGRIELRPGSSA